MTRSPTRREPARTSGSPKVSLEEGLEAEYRWLASAPALAAWRRRTSFTDPGPRSRCSLARAAACASGPKKPPAGTPEPDKFLFERGTEALKEEWLDGP